MRPQQKRLDDLEALLTKAISNLEDARLKVATETAGHEGAANGLAINLTLAEHARDGLAREQETLIATRDSLRSELAAVEKRISANVDETLATETVATEARARLSKATEELEAVRAKDQPLIRKREAEVAKLQRRITTVRAYKPEAALKALFPGGTTEDQTT